MKLRSKDIEFADYKDVTFVHVPQLNNGSVAKTTFESETQPKLHKALLELDEAINEINARKTEKKSYRGTK